MIHLLAFSMEAHRYHFSSIKVSMIIPPRGGSLIVAFRNSLASGSWVPKKSSMVKQAVIKSGNLTAKSLTALVKDLLIGLGQRMEEPGDVLPLQLRKSGGKLVRVMQVHH